MTTYSL
ncbi:hypothetical protein D050_3658A, partial [Vibrio parahaemolyticus VPCR-2009]